MISPINHAAGVWPVVLTPFRPDGKIDFPAYRKLLEYYIAEGVAGLFAVCLSSELYQLTPSERLELAREAVAVSGGRVPVVACGYLGNTEAEKLQSVFDMAVLGMDAVVIPACLLVPQEAGDEALFAAFETLLAQTAEIRLGIYRVSASVSSAHSSAAARAHGASCRGASRIPERHLLRLGRDCREAPRLRRNQPQALQCEPDDLPRVAEARRGGIQRNFGQFLSGTARGIVPLFPGRPGTRTGTAAIFQSGPASRRIQISAFGQALSEPLRSADG